MLNLLKSPSDKTQLVLTCLITLFIPVTLLAILYTQQGKELTETGERAAAMNRRLEQLEDYITSDFHHAEASEKYTVVMLGDSTHYYGMQPHQELPVQVTNAFPEAINEAIQLISFRSAGLDAFDFYFLTHLLMLDPPDMIVVPVNLRSFGEVWLTTESSQYPTLERFVPWSEIPRATDLSTSSRIISWDRIARRKFDYALTNGKVGSFLRGTKLSYDTRLADLRNSFQLYFYGCAEYASEDWLTNTERFMMQEYKRYPKEITPGDPMLKAFLALNQLASAYDVEVVYYTVESNRTNVHQREMHHLIATELLNDKNVHVIDTLGLLKPNHFLRREHLTIEGLTLLGRYLSVEVGTLIQHDAGLSGVSFQSVEKRNRSSLEILREKVQALSPAELDAFIESLDPEAAQNVRILWEKKMGLSPKHRAPIPPRRDRGRQRNHQQAETSWYHDAVTDTRSLGWHPRRVSQISSPQAVRGASLLQHPFTLL